MTQMVCSNSAGTVRIVPLETNFLQFSSLYLNPSTAASHLHFVLSGASIISQLLTFYYRHKQMCQ